MSTLSIERETSLVYNEEEALLWSASSIFWRKMEKLDVVPINQTEHSRSYRVPKRWVVVRKPKIMSEEHKEKAAARFREMWAKEKGEGPVTEDE